MSESIISVEGLTKNYGRLLPVLILAVLVVSFLFVPTAKGQPGVEWRKTYGGADQEIGGDFLKTDDGGYVLAGSTESYGSGGYDFWLVKTSSDGDKEWSRTYGGSKDDWAVSVIRTRDGGYALAGITKSYGESSFWLVKTDSQGNREWSKTFGKWPDAWKEEGEEILLVQQTWVGSVCQAQDDGYVLAGQTLWGKDSWLLKVDSNGNKEWRRTYGEAKDKEAAPSVIQSQDCGYAAIGQKSNTEPSSTDAWLLKTSSQGDEKWSKVYGGSEADRGESVVQTRKGEYVVAGETMSFGNGAYDFWLVKTDTQGNKEWSKTYGGKGQEFAKSVIQTQDNGYVLAGGTKSYGSGAWDFWLVKTDSKGDKKWSKTIGGPDNDRGWSVAQTQDGDYILSGQTESYGSGEADFCLMKLAGEEKAGGVGGLPLIWIGIGTATVIISAVAGLVILRKS